MTPLLALVAAYLIGAIPFGYLIVKWMTGADVRASGSGNIGATNVLRTTGRAAGIITLLLDIAKGTTALWLADKLTGGNIHWMSAAALAVMAGHAFPIFLKFQGGKAVASFIGAYLYLAPVPLLAVLIVWVAVVAYTRQVSMGSILAAGTFPSLCGSSCSRPCLSWPPPQSAARLSFTATAPTSPASAMAPNTFSRSARAKRSRLSDGACGVHEKSRHHRRRLVGYRACYSAGSTF